MAGFPESKFSWFNMQAITCSKTNYDKHLSFEFLGKKPLSLGLNWGSEHVLVVILWGGIVHLYQKDSGLPCIT